MANIGMVGIGAMGTPMARNLLKAGHTLQICDLSQVAVDALVANGAQPATQDQLAHNVDIILTMLPTSEIVTEVLTGEAGLFSQAAKDTLFIDSSTIDVDTARTLSAQATAAGMAMVDAPVSGGVPGAEQATLTFMVGGPEKDFLRARPILEAMGQLIVSAGPSGAGQAAKICNNMILGISMIAVAEAFQLAGKLGLSAETLHEIVSRSSGDCWVVKNNHPVPGLIPTSASNNDYRPGFSSGLMLKDLQLSQNAANYFGAYTPLGAKATELYNHFVQAGNRELDFGAIIQAIATKESQR